MWWQSPCARTFYVGGLLLFALGGCDDGGGGPQADAGADLVVCGEGTVRVENECWPAGEGVQCGPGTHEVGGQCVPQGALSCGPGTHEVEGRCVPEAAPTTCGAGTVWVEGACVPEAPLMCGIGTHEVDGLCSPDYAEVECGEGTELVEGVCVPRCPEGMVYSPHGCAPVGYAVMPAGAFLIGSAEDQRRDENEGPQRPVSFERPLWVKRTEVTVGEWAAVVGNQPAHFTEQCGEDCPVEQVNWYEAVAYANLLSDAEGLEACYVLEGCEGTLGHGLPEEEVYQCAQVTLWATCTGYRLPTEAEWEYSYRAGTAGPYYAEPVEAIAWHAGNSDHEVWPVALKLPNAWGLYDMAGNVSEWVWDWYSDSYGEVDQPWPPLGPEEGTYRVLRGGSWSAYGWDARASQRSYSPPATRHNSMGFRLVRALP